MEGGGGGGGRGRGQGARGEMEKQTKTKKQRKKLQSQGESLTHSSSALPELLTMFQRNLKVQCAKFGPIYGFYIGKSSTYCPVNTFVKVYTCSTMKPIWFSCPENGSHTCERSTTCVFRSLGKFRKGSLAFAMSQGETDIGDNLTPTLTTSTTLQQGVGPRFSFPTNKHVFSVRQKICFCCQLRSRQKQRAKRAVGDD